MAADLAAMGPMPAVALADVPERCTTTDACFPVEVGTYTFNEDGMKVASARTAARSEVEGAPEVTPFIAEVWNKKGDLSDVGFGAVFLWLGVSLGGAPAAAPPPPMGRQLSRQLTHDEALVIAQQVADEAATKTLEALAAAPIAVKPMPALTKSGSSLRDFIGNSRAKAKPRLVHQEAESEKTVVATLGDHAAVEPEPPYDALAQPPEPMTATAAVRAAAAATPVSVWVTGAPLSPRARSGARRTPRR